jgi:hypothetical protein
MCSGDLVNMDHCYKNVITRWIKMQVYKDKVFRSIAEPSMKNNSCKLQKKKLNKIRHESQLY